MCKNRGILRSIWVFGPVVAPDYMAASNSTYFMFYIFGLRFILTTTYVVEV